ncbi:anthranilate phosphoribosyltransferase, putative [Babesia ovata]|uniref:Anthranilate phosphoribosyltransferase, putative n=1 Tax=Babesia ovata TaxID=189622 RepID=A0A2H6KAB6_9APIC|nr:anthranilate phosphoribosyltransferase, putative [Babesia ovata]GBE59930.1 anthranilate phosphoribosyltransferase, putative [Babesia ovata]
MLLGVIYYGVLRDETVGGMGQDLVGELVVCVDVHGRYDAFVRHAHDGHVDCELVGRKFPQCRKQNLLVEQVGLAEQPFHQLVGGLDYKV